MSHGEQHTGAVDRHDAMLEVLERIGQRADALAAEFHRVAGLLSAVHADAVTGARYATDETLDLWRRLRDGAAEGQQQARQVMAVLTSLGARLTALARATRGIAVHS